MSSHQISHPIFGIGSVLVDNGSELRVRFSCGVMDVESSSVRAFNINAIENVKTLDVLPAINGSLSERVEAFFNAPGAFDNDAIADIQSMLNSVVKEARNNVSTFCVSLLKRKALGYDISRYIAGNKSLSNYQSVYNGLIREGMSPTQVILAIDAVKASGRQVSIFGQSTKKALALLSEVELTSRGKLSPLVAHSSFTQRGGDALEAIYEWWQADGATHRKEYLKKLYPGGDMAGLSLDGSGINRAAWMTLFSLAVFQRLGRARSAQHRGFIEYMQRKGWWQTICDNDPKQHSDAWLNILKEFAESNEYGQEYDSWLDCFPRLYQLAYWLEEYVNLFAGFQFRSIHELNSNLFLNPVADPAMQGSGWIAPAIDRTMKIGVNLVVRELLRNKVIDNPATYALAFMPVKRVRKLFDAIDLCVEENCTSEDIWRHLQRELGIERAAFGGDFDIPFLILAESDYLLEQVCGISISESSDSPDYREEFA